MKKLVTLEINGERTELSVEPSESLLQVLRRQAGLTGTKRGCDSGGCGCCTVHLDGKAVYSCMVFASSLENSKVTTIEGLSAGGELDPLQTAFIEKGAVQCGYCTCGIIMTAKEFLTHETDPDEEQIRHAIAGNLCRCTGYHKIVEAIKTVGS
ncbi:MAG: (2Fe-2S)-binding protein [Lysobacterales bacterium]|jgi:carbon-monoxide dehydrogenase small subunit